LLIKIDHRQNPSTQVFPPLQGKLAVGSHSVPSVCVVPQTAKLLAPSLTVLQSGVAVCAAHAVWFGLSHDT
jgi:hypothetical protein